MTIGVFYGKGGERHEIPLDARMYKDAAEAGCSVPQYLERKHQDITDAATQGTIWSQLLEQNGMVMDGNPITGLGPAKMAHILDGGIDASIVRDAVPASRILAPAAVLEMVEVNLAADKTSDIATFEKMIGYNFSVNDDRFEQPVVDFSANDSVRSKAIGQLAAPQLFGRLTVADRMGSIPTYSLGLEMSDKAQKAYTFDFVTRLIARQAAAEKAARVNGHINALVNGDADTQQAALPKVAAKTFDTAAVGKKLTHKAYISWLRRNRARRHIDWVMCDLATYFKIIGREGRPTIQTMPAVYPEANDSAVQELVMRRGTEMRFDFGELVFRGEDAAWDVLELTQS